MAHLTDKLVRSLERPSTGNKITYDDEIRGFGVRVTAAGAISFVINYRRRSDGVEKRFTIGTWPAWSVAAARDEAARLRRDIDVGADPVGQLRDQRAAPTVNDLCDRFEEEHLPRKRQSTAKDYVSIIRAHIRPFLGKRKVASLSYAEVDALHRSITRNGASYRANRTIAVLSKMCSLAMQWRWRTDNPCHGIERNDEHKRKRYLSAAELERLSKVLAAYENRDVADILRLLLLTGARRGECLAARWDSVDLTAGTWTKPAHTTKQRTEHTVPLSAPARQLLSARPRESEFVFPGRAGRPRTDIDYDWGRICKLARIQGLRVHDLRHTFAGSLASSGVSLHIIGGLLGHVNPATTSRYAHLTTTALSQAAETAGALLTGKPAADIVPMKRRRW